MLSYKDSPLEVYIVKNVVNRLLTVHVGGQNEVFISGEEFDDYYMFPLKFTS